MPGTAQPSNASANELAAVLRSDIIEGKYSSQFAFPSFRELASQHGVSMRVVRAAVDMLEHEGLVYRRERRGTFVRSAADRIDADTHDTTLRCINFVERPTGTTPAFVRTDYLRGFTDALENVDVKMRIVNAPAAGADYETIFSPNFPFTEQGCVLINLTDPALLRWLADHDIPFVVQSHACYDKQHLPPHHSIAVNKVGGGFLATQHLLDLGHRRIGFIGRAGRKTDVASQVYEGYDAALRCAAVERIDDDILEFATDELQHAVPAVREYMHRDDLPTALVAETDMTAIGVLQAARELNINVPDELSVVGYNDQIEAESAGLTTVSNRSMLLGRSTVELLLDAVNDRFDEPQTRVLPCRLVERASTASPTR